jgi:excisionase family DNA binding protein
MKIGGEVSCVLTVKQVATMLGITPAAVYQAAARGRLPARRWNGRVLFLASEFDEFLKALPSRAVTHAATGQPLSRDE